MKIRRFSGALVLAVLLCLPGYSDERFETSANFFSGFPQREFKQNVKRAGIGGSGYFAYKFKNSPFSAGASLGILVYGSETRAEFLAASIPEVEVNVTTRNYILMCHLVFRVQPLEGDFRPYAEGLAGFHHLWTETGIYDRGYCHERIASSVNLSDFAWSFGAGCGVMIKVFEHRKNGNRNLFAMFIDLGARFLKGGRAEYLHEGSICQKNEQLIYDVKMSDTDLVTARLGLSFVF
ncbi:MAG: hypothetical protein JSV17_09420 [Candidatus Aminicenantes bacterium]|nr:MAG: hypothetical protein JSV17_09420 [Candidatus Aminicenantes bacterium]